MTHLRLDIEVWSAAVDLVAAHGADAWLHVAMEADRCLDAGDIDGQRKWLRVKDAVEWLAGTEGAHPFKVSR